MTGKIKSQRKEGRIVKKKTFKRNNSLKCIKLDENYHLIDLRCLKSSKQNEELQAE